MLQPEGEEGEGQQYEENMDIVEGEGQEGEGRQGQQQRERITTRYLTKYERARVLGTRALQIRCARMNICPQRAAVAWQGLACGTPRSALSLRHCVITQIDSHML